MDERKELFRSTQDVRSRTVGKALLHLDDDLKNVKHPNLSFLLVFFFWLVKMLTSSGLDQVVLSSLHIVQITSQRAMRPYPPDRMPSEFQQDALGQGRNRKYSCHNPPPSL